MAAYIDGRRLWWGGRRRLEEHFADCDRCFTLLRDIMDFRDSERRGRRRTPTEGPRDSWCMPCRPPPPRLAWLSAGGLGAVAAALLVVFVLRGPADPSARSADRRAGHPARHRCAARGLPARAATGSVALERAGCVRAVDFAGGRGGRRGAFRRQAATSTTRRRTSRRRGQPLDYGRHRQRHRRTSSTPSTAEPANATYLSDLAAALLTRGIRQQNPAGSPAGAQARRRGGRSRRPAPRSLVQSRAGAGTHSVSATARAAWNDYLQVMPHRPGPTRRVSVCASQCHYGLDASRTRRPSSRRVLGAGASARREGRGGSAKTDGDRAAASTAQPTRVSDSSDTCRRPSSSAASAGSCHNPIAWL